MWARPQDICESVVVAIAMFGSAAVAGGQYGGGTGTAADPCLIYTPAQMNTLGTEPNDWGKHFQLMADIDWAVYTGTQFHIIGCTEGQGTAGGLVGGSLDDIRDCHAIGAVTGFSDIGGLAGRHEFGTIADSYATGAVSGMVNVGGLAGYNKNEWGHIVSCLAAGAVAGPSQTGGLVGMNSGTIANSRASGSVSGQRSVGGLVGRNGERVEISNWPTREFPGVITNCYSTGHVSNATPAGGLIGLQECGSVTASFRDKETSGQTASAGGIGKSTAELCTAATFLDAGWDFVAEVQNGTADIWWIRAGGGYPQLWWERDLNRP